MIKVILPVGKIPPGSTVTKVGGTKPYKLHDEIKVWNHAASYDTREQQLLRADGAKYLTDEDGNITAVPDSLELLWRTDEEELFRYLTCLLDDAEGQ